MRVYALLSGGKDSIYALKKASENHEIVGVIAITSDEDSKFFHRENIEMVKLQCQSMNIPLTYEETNSENEIDDLENVIGSISDNADAIVSGAIASSYQKDILDRICDKYNLECLSPLWNVDESEYMQELIENDFKIMITEVAADGLDESWLGKVLDNETLDDLEELADKYGINVSFEGGGAETLVLDCPLFEQRIVIKDLVKKWDGMRGVLEIKDAKLV